MNITALYNDVSKARKALVQEAKTWASELPHLSPSDSTFNEITEALHKLNVDCKAIRRMDNAIKELEEAYTDVTSIIQEANES